MPYVNLKNKQALIGALAPVVGKALGKLENEVESKLNEQIDNFRREGCPNLGTLGNIDKDIQNIIRTIGQIENRLSKIRKIPKRLKRPAKALDKAIKIILKLPIPQAVFGFGIPVGITTKFSDVLHLLKETVAKLNEEIDSITAILDSPESILKGIREKLNKFQIPTMNCKVEAALREEVDKGNLSIEELTNKGLFNPEDEVYIFSSLLPVFMGDIDGNTPDELINGLTIDQAIESLEKSLTTLETLNVDESIKDNLRRTIDRFRNSTKEEQVTSGAYQHTGPNGIVYTLEIEKVPDSPSIAPQRYAIAKDPSGVIVLKGPKSFSSSEIVLLEEVKFRIDNQLP